MIAFSQFFGQHGYLPDLVDLRHNVNMHATFVAAGPGINGKASRFPWATEPHRGLGGKKAMRAIDVAPTLSFVLGIPGPQNARGKIRYDIVDDTRESVSSRSSTSATGTVRPCRWPRTRIGSSTPRPLSTPPHSARSSRSAARRS